MVRVFKNIDDRWKTILLVAAAFVLVRALLLAAVYNISGGTEFTYDVRVHFHLAGAPFEPFSGTRYWAGQYPPLQGMLEAILLAPLRYLVGDFLAIRTSFIIWEAFSVFLTWLCMERMNVPARLSRLILLLLVIMPSGWMTSAVMAQEEVMAGAFVAGAMLLWARDRSLLAIALCGLGVGAGKIFLVLPLFAMVLASVAGGGGIRPVIAGALTSALPYTPMLLASFFKGESVPLIGFTPTFEFTSGIWNLGSSLSNISSVTAKRISLILGLLGAMAPLMWFFLRGALRGISVRRLSLTLLVMLLWFLNLFYHVNPEYFAIVLPLMAVALRDTRTIVLGYMALSLPWAVNFFYGVSIAMSRGALGGQGGFVNLFGALFPGRPGGYLTAALIVTVIANLTLVIHLTTMLFNYRENDSGLS